jgi:hypothetical protein
MEKVYTLFLLKLLILRIFQFPPRLPWKIFNVFW